MRHFCKLTFILAAVCTTLSFVPQFIKIHRQGGRDLSNGMLLLYLLGVGLRLVYRMRLDAVEVIGANVVAQVLWCLQRS